MGATTSKLEKKLVKTTEHKKKSTSAHKKTAHKKTTHKKTTHKKTTHKKTTHKKK